MITQTSIPQPNPTAAVAGVGERVAAAIRARREGYLPSTGLDRAWIAGWRAATDDHAATVAKVRPALSGADVDVVVEQMLARQVAGGLTPDRRDSRAALLAALDVLGFTVTSQRCETHYPFAGMGCPACGDAPVEFEPDDPEPGRC